MLETKGGLDARHGLLHVHQVPVVVAIGLVFFSRDERLAALRDLAEDEEDDVPEDADEHDLVELVGLLHEHEVHLFEGETTAANSH